LSLKKLQKYEKYRYDLHTAILRTNSQIHDEASMILYGRNFFTWLSGQQDSHRPRADHCNTQSNSTAVHSLDN
jgi:hypothetical protein